ncbi:HAD family hydrolase [Frigidibacter sp. ROC022]|uniref:HAD family hydrolase n=1 Tax=Frigidibacter sp. ROC022 TaxID=2971796 RepID=UPI00215AFAF7|nr:HAD family hydrolase [Frigidibacter sp. ROC022]MCR8722754.1 HAD family hydrolase [Frigidibacter sp. ROC022]
MTLPAPQLLTAPDTQVRRAVRRLRWFRRAFLEQIAVVSEDSGIAFDVDTIRLAEAFVEWSAAFESRKPTAQHDKRRYVDHVSGLMLDRLLRKAPLSARHHENVENPDSAAQFWPEGYACVVFCLNVRAAVLAQDFGETVEDAPQMNNLRDWMSFRDSVAERPEIAISYLQHFAGLEPDWQFPDLFRTSPRTPQPQLTLVHPSERHTGPAPRQSLPADFAMAVFDLDAISNSRELVAEALTHVLGLYGYALTDDLIDQPLAASMTYVAMRSGQLCPRGFIDHFRNAIAKIFADQLQLAPSARATLARLTTQGVKVLIAVNDDKASGPDLAKLLDIDGLAELCGTVEPEQVDKKDKTSLWVSTDSTRLQSAERCGFHALGIKVPARRMPEYPGETIASLSDFPFPSR